MKSKPRRWRLWTCIEGDRNSASDMRICKYKMDKEVEALRKKGFKAKRWAPRQEHLTSGHFHIVVLCTFDELCKLVGIDKIKASYKGKKLR